MNVRVVTGVEKLRLQPWRRPWLGQARALDAEEHRELVHLYRTRQATAGELAIRYGISRRSVFRYVNDHPIPSEHDRAARRVYIEAQRMDLRLSRGECQRLALAALSERKPAEGAA